MNDNRRDVREAASANKRPASCLCKDGVVCPACWDAIMNDEKGMDHGFLCGCEACHEKMLDERTLGEAVADIAGWL